MARFYFHFRSGPEFVADPAGTELPGLAAARERAIETLREIVAGDVRDGHLDSSATIEIVDASGLAVAHIGFSDALRLGAPLPSGNRAS